MIDNKNLFVRIKKNLFDLFNSASKPKKKMKQKLQTKLLITNKKNKKKNDSNINFLIPSYSFLNK